MDAAAGATRTASAAHPAARAPAVATGRSGHATASWVRVCITPATAAAGDHFVDRLRQQSGPSVGFDHKAAATAAAAAAGVDAVRLSGVIAPRAAGDDLQRRTGLKIDVSARHRAEAANASIAVGTRIDDKLAAASLSAIGRDVVIAGGLSGEGLDFAGTGK